MTVKKYFTDTCTLVSEDLSPPFSLDSSVPSCNSITMWLVGFLLLLKARHYIPDACVNSLLKFLHILFCILVRTWHHFFLLLCITWKGQSNILESCKHHRLYRLDNSITHTGIHQTSKSCSFVRFPNHWLCRFRVACGQVLLKKVIFFSGIRIFKVFPYRPLFRSLQHLLLRWVMPALEIC